MCHAKYLGIDFPILPRCPALAGRLYRDVYRLLLLIFRDIILSYFMFSGISSRKGGGGALGGLGGVGKQTLTPTKKGWGWGTEI